MAQITLEQASKLNEGGGSYFKLDPDESKQVRFLWDKWEEVSSCCYSVHELMRTTADGKKYFTTVDCPRTEGSPVECKYCEGKKKGETQVGRVIIPMYNVAENEVQYWKRSIKWLTNTLKPVLDEVANLPSIANQTFKIKRIGTGMDTTYTVLPVMNSQDNRTKADFGELKNPYDLGMIKKYGEEDTQDNQNQNQQTQPTTGYQRRTVEEF